MIKAIKRLSQIHFCKKLLGILFFHDVVDTDIHKERKNKITTKFVEKDKICDSFLKMILDYINQDFAYKNYLLNNKDKNKLSKKDFFLKKQKEKWNKINKCC